MNTTEEFKPAGSVASLSVFDPAAPKPVSSKPVSSEAALPARSHLPELALMADSIEKKLLEGRIVANISKVYDPEIPVNVYELGLIYGIDIFEDKSVRVRMTLTAPGCPVAGSLPLEVEKQVEDVAEVKEAEVVLVWEPAWDKSRMSEAAMLQLNLF